MDFVKAQHLTHGDMIDLEIIFEEIDSGPLDSDIHEYELAIVESISIEGDDEVVIYTNQHNVAVPINFEVEIAGIAYPTVNRVH